MDKCVNQGEKEKNVHPETYKTLCWAVAREICELTPVTVCIKLPLFWVDDSGSSSRISDQILEENSRFSVLQSYSTAINVLGT